MIITNQLDASQAAQIAALEAVCKKYDLLQGSIFLSGELNFDPELPCFYLLYNPDNDKELIAFLSVFAPLSAEAEIYAYTAPAYRRQGCFNSLLEAALHTLQKYGVRDILFVYEPVSAAVPAVLDNLYAEYQYSEYLMTRSSSPEASALPDGLCLTPAADNEICSLASLHALAFRGTEESSLQFLANVFSSSASHARKLNFSGTDQTVGICFFTVGVKEISIFSVAVHPDHRQKGYAALMLQALLSELNLSYPSLPVTLEVNSLNTPAFSLYQKLGFQICTQFDYSYADSAELLELFGD